MGKEELISGEIVRKVWIVSIVWIILSGAATALGQGKTVKITLPGDLSAPVLPRSSVKYSDLLKQLFTDFDEDTVSATGTIPIRHVSGDHDEMPLHGHFKIDSLDMLELRDPQGPRIVIEIDITTDDDSRATVYGSESSIIAAFRLSPSVKLLDALDIKADQYTGICDRPTVVSIGPKQSAFFISNGHFNTSASFELISAFFLSHDRLNPIFTFQPDKKSTAVTASDLLLLDEHYFDSTTSCNVETDETVAFVPIPQPGKAYFKLGVRVSVTKRVFGDECRRTVRRSTYYRGGWEWDTARKRYRESRGGNLDLLDKLNSGK